MSNMYLRLLCMSLQDHQTEDRNTTVTQLLNDNEASAFGNIAFLGHVVNVLKLSEHYCCY